MRNRRLSFYQRYPTRFIPETDYRDNWRSLFRNDEPVATDDSDTNPRALQAEIHPVLSPTATNTFAQNELSAITNADATPQPMMSTFAVPTLPVATATPLPLATFVLPTLSPARDTGAASADSRVADSSAFGYTVSGIPNPGRMKQP